MTLRSALGRVRGLGSARSGVQHWWQQRVTAVLLVPLTFWFVGSLMALDLTSRQAVMRWLESPLAAVLMMLFMISLLHHAQLGMQVVIEDYVEPEWQKIACILIVKFLAVLAGLVAVLSVLKLFLGL